MSYPWRGSYIRLSLWVAGFGRETFASRQTDNKRRDRVTERHTLGISQSFQQMEIGTKESDSIFR